jgi:hypothetical protein
MEHDGVICRSLPVEGGRVGNSERTSPRRMLTGRDRQTVDMSRQAAVLLALMRVRARQGIWPSFGMLVC